MVSQQEKALDHLVGAEAQVLDDLGQDVVALVVGERGDERAAIPRRRIRVDPVGKQDVYDDAIAVRDAVEREGNRAGPSVLEDLIGVDIRTVPVITSMRSALTNALWWTRQSRRSTR